MSPNDQTTLTKTTKQEVLLLLEIQNDILKIGSTCSTSTSYQTMLNVNASLIIIVVVVVVRKDPRKLLKPIE